MSNDEIERIPGVNWPVNTPTGQEVEASIKNANNLIDIADAVLKTGDIEIDPDNTEKMMEDTKGFRDGEGMGDIQALLESIENDNVSPEGTKKLARSTAKFLKSWEDETSYNDAMEVVKK